MNCLKLIASAASALLFLLAFVAPATAQETFRTEPLKIESRDGKIHEFIVELALNDGQRQQGLMNRKSMELGKGMLFDFGIHYNTGYRSVEIGASVQNFGANVTYAKESNPVPLLFRWGIAGNLIGKESLFGQDDVNRIGVAFDLFQPNDYAQQEHIGIEYEYAEIFSLRAGYKFNYDFEGLTLGGGIRQPLGAFTLSLDYSYSSIGTYLGNAHRISLGVRL